MHTGGTDRQIDLANPSNLGQQSTDSGTVPNLKWRFGDSKTRIYPGGWVREQVDNDLPASHDIAAAQQHLKKGAIRELHWHRVVCLTHNIHSVLCACVLMYDIYRQNGAKFSSVACSCLPSTKKADIK
jgi:hypothetical protein